MGLLLLVHYATVSLAATDCTYLVTTNLWMRNSLSSVTLSNVVTCESNLVKIKFKLTAQTADASASKLLSVIFFSVIFYGDEY